MSDPVVDLSAELREFGAEVNEHLTRVTGSLRDQASWVAEVAPVIDGHTTALLEHGARLVEDTRLLVELREQVNELLEEMPRQSKFPPVCWLRLTAHQAEQVWTWLGEWVDEVLVARYSANRAEVPDCWALHPGAVEALTWLRTSWLHAFLPAAGANPAAEWHTRWRRAAFDEVQEAVVREAVATRREKCGPGTHLGAPLPGADPPFVQHAPAVVPAGVPAGRGDQPWSNPAPWEPDPTMPPVSVPRGPSGHEHDLGRDPLTDLAERRFWWPHLLAANAADVARRREVERIAAEAQAAEETAAKAASGTPAPAP